MDDLIYAEIILIGGEWDGVCTEASQEITYIQSPSMISPQQGNLLENPKDLISSSQVRRFA
jgi:hypothetical protein